MIYLDLGRRSTGKSTLAYYMVRDIAPRVIFDPRGLFPSDDRAESFEQIATWFDRRYDPPDDRPASPELVITPDTDVQGMFAFAADELKTWIKTNGGRAAFLVDEARMIDPQTDGLNYLLRYANNDDVTVIFTAHRPADIPTSIRAISDYWCLFHATQEHDLKVIGERCGSAVAAQVQRLPRHHFIVWDDGRGVASIRNRPADWYRPLRDEAVRRSAETGRESRLPAGSLLASDGTEASLFKP